MASPVRAANAAQAHPLFSGESPTKSPGPSSLVNRPIWGQRKATKVDYSADPHHSAVQRRSVSRSSSYYDGAGSSASSLRPAPVDDDVFFSRNAPSSTSQQVDDGGDSSHTASYIPRTSRVSSYDLQFDDADEPSLPDDSLFGGPAPTSPQLFDRILPAPRPTRASALSTGLHYAAASPNQTPMPKQHLGRPSSRSSRKDGAASPSEDRARRSSTPSGSRTSAAIASNTQANRVHDLAREFEFPVDWLQQLHRLGDHDLESALAGPLPHRPLSSKQPRESTPVKSSTPNARRDAAKSQSYAAQLTKALSKALAEAHAELDSLRATTAQERVQHTEAIEHMQQRSESRESALTSLCLDHGIKQGQINRSLLRAPVLDAEMLKRKRIAEQQQSLAQEKAGIELVPDRSDQALPDSLQEAMLEDLEGVANSSFAARSPSLKPASIHSVADPVKMDRSPSLRSQATTASTDGALSRRQRGKSLSISIASTQDRDSDARSIKSSAASFVDSVSTSPSSRHRSATFKASTQPPASPQSLHKAKSPQVASPRARSTSSSASGGLGDWASGLLPWSGGGASRKAAPSTAQSMVKATSPGRREMAQSAAEAAGKRAVSGSKGSRPLQHLLLPEHLADTRDHHQLQRLHLQHHSPTSPVCQTPISLIVAVLTLLDL